MQILQKQNYKEVTLLIVDDDDPYHPLPGDELNADNTVPVAPLMGGENRQGLLVDIEV